jgi:hypothetical protein
MTTTRDPARKAQDPLTRPPISPSFRLHPDGSALAAAETALASSRALCAKLKHELLDNAADRIKQALALTDCSGKAVVDAKELAELRRDKERLDWRANCTMAEANAIHEFCNRHGPEYQHTPDLYRAAIDAALAKGGRK